jgi:hypothetical protein
VLKLEGSGFVDDQDMHSFEITFYTGGVRRRWVLDLPSVEVTDSKPEMFALFLKLMDLADWEEGFHDAPKY